MFRAISNTHRIGMHSLNTNIKANTEYSNTPNGPSTHKRTFYVHDFGSSLFSLSLSPFLHLLYFFMWNILIKKNPCKNLRHRLRHCHTNIAIFVVESFGSQTNEEKKTMLKMQFQMEREFIVFEFRSDCTYIWSPIQLMWALQCDRRDHNSTCTRVFWIQIHIHIWILFFYTISSLLLCFGVCILDVGYVSSVVYCALCYVCMCASRNEWRSSRKWWWWKWQ